MQIQYSSQVVKARQPCQVVVYLIQNSLLRERPHQSFSHGELGQWMPCNFVTDSFHTEKLRAILYSCEVRFYAKNSRLLFEPPEWTTYDLHLRLIGKRVVFIELLSLGVTAKALRANIEWKSAISLQRGQFDPKFRVQGLAPTNHSSFKKTRLQIFRLV